jgi:hypothetical protein
VQYDCTEGTRFEIVERAGCTTSPQPERKKQAPNEIAGSEGMQAFRIPVVRIGGGYRHEVAELRPAFRYHDLRHTYCSRLVAAGVPLLEVQQLAGHKSYSTTLRYAHLSSDHRKRAVEKVEFSPFCSGLHIHSKSSLFARHFGETRKRKTIEVKMRLRTLHRSVRYQIGTGVDYAVKHYDPHQRDSP